eukprot:396753-Hanusia_phi.AAC.1
MRYRRSDANLGLLPAPIISDHKNNVASSCSRPVMMIWSVLPWSPPPCRPPCRSQASRHAMV